MVNEGYRLLRWIESDYHEKVKSGTFNAETDNKKYGESFEQWANNEVVPELNSIFPTQLEENIFANRDTPTSVVYRGIDQHFGELRALFSIHIKQLQAILKSSLMEYTDLPLQSRIYVEDIDSFQKVRDINPGIVSHLLKDGRIELSEDSVQLGLKQILDVPFHKRDWGGEINDLYTANLLLNGRRVSTAFLLKGNGLSKKVMEIADCGKHGDQLVRLLDSPAELFVVQFIGEISETIIKDMEGKVSALRSGGKNVCFCIMNGQDTARLLQPTVSCKSLRYRDVANGKVTMVI